MQSQLTHSNFIATETFGQGGEKGEKLVWEKVRGVFRTRTCLGYWRYPIFCRESQGRKEPDILIVDRDLGIIIIEVKSIRIEQLVKISGYQWQYNDFYHTTGNPYQQAQQQLFSLLEYCDREPQLKEKITARVLIALPFIHRQEWEKKGFNKLPSNPPILFKETLKTENRILWEIEKSPLLRKGGELNKQQWQLLLSVLGGTPLHQKPIHRVLSAPHSRGQILKTVKSQISQLDENQEKIGKQIPPGCQRIRGCAGSGKTVILCQKAAAMHLKHPQWCIALVFFSRHLYGVICQELDRWLNYFSKGEVRYSPKSSQLKVFHAWGSKNQPGFYSYLCNITKVHRLSVNETHSKKPNESLAEACIHLLTQTAIPPVFDAILIDEAQDLIVEQGKFENKQPFYWLAYQALHPVDITQPEQKRLIWAYDELQSLDSMAIPSPRELFGEELGHLVTGIYPDGIKKTEVLIKSYRIPEQVLNVAYAMVMGFLRPQGLLTGMCTKEEWETLGYEMKGEFQVGKSISLSRIKNQSPHPLNRLWQKSCIEFNVYRDRQQEFYHLGQNILYNLKQEGLRPSEILVLILGYPWAVKTLEQDTANYLIQQGIDIYLPGSSKYNNYNTVESKFPPDDRFRDEGSITLSSVHRAKGQEADLVYIIGLDQIGQHPSNLKLRNQFFIALTRTRAWVNISGIGTSPLYAELRQVLHQKEGFTIPIKKQPQRQITVTDAGAFLQEYALGRRNFRNANLENINLEGACLHQANLIGANLRRANLEKANLEEVNLINADLTYANLKGAYLHKAKLTGAILTGTILEEFNF